MSDKREPTDPKNKAFIKPKGRPPLITLELIDSICNAIKMGSYIETAAQLNGISKACFYKWLKKGSKGKGLYGLFVDSVQRALAESEIRDLQVVDKEARGRPAEYDKQGKKLREEVVPNWKAATWRLERKHPERWGRREQVKLTEGEEEEGFSAEGSHDKIMSLIEFYKDRKRRESEE